MGKFVSGLFLGALALALMVYTGSRTLDLMGWMLPANQQIYQYLALAAFDGGMVFWAWYFIAGAKGTYQRGISLVMACFDIIAVAVCTVADGTLNAAQKGEIAQIGHDQAQAIVIFVNAVIVISVAAFLACKMLSVENLRKIKEQDAEDQIYNAGLKAISALAPSIASDAAPYLAEEWANRTWQRIVPGVRHETRYIGQSSQQSIDTRQQRAPLPAAQPATRALPQQQRKKGFFASLNPFANKESEAQSIDTRPAPSQRVYKQLPRQQQRQYSPLAAQRRTARLARLRGHSIDRATEEIQSVPLARATLAAEAQTSSTPVTGSRGKKQAKAPGKTRVN